MGRPRLDSGSVNYQQIAGTNESGPSGEATEEREVATVPPAAIRARYAAVGTAAGTPPAFRNRLQRPGFDLLRTERRPSWAGPHLPSHRTPNAQSGDQRRQ